MLKLGRAQGAAISAALARQIPVYEYAPRKIKMAITGKGAASKEQVKAMVEHTMDVKLDIKHLDASDAVAIAMCHFYQLTNPLKDNGAPTNWKQFVEMHSERVKKS
jgi:crossover junction endodeoxyribonuclease RuvC